MWEIIASIIVGISCLAFIAMFAILAYYISTDEDISDEFTFWK